MTSFASRAASALERISHHLSTVEILYASHPAWPLPPSAQISPPKSLQISVLDSSFNPPTLAHLALAKASLPPSHQRHAADYDAKLLLLSVRNADKTLKPTDATYIQRMEMMVLLAKNLSSSTVISNLDDPSMASSLVDGVDLTNVAVGIIDEPIFVRKSTILQAFLRDRLETIQSSSLSLHSTSLPSITPSLTFILGQDTLIRLFTSSYYHSHPHMLSSLRSFFAQDTHSGSRVLCAHRIMPGLATAPSVATSDTLNDPLAAATEFIESGSIAMVDIGADEQTLSSSEVREKILVGDKSWQSMVPQNVIEYISAQNLYTGNV
ncbi:hypothetical protein JAAARDRAFT_35648 [Jaapia argillacea MUCL 33604]|uniref:Nicotinamide-nucleotide adenylyltransferase n=1 Tax=Jaapia argillacea MUCL 33604 TaxID=933084 RepID=A0A067Q0P0_9AGAM|nr:hypothetical protein JAAARDRAFT_35648 [Jaapia argillacea MUCL 33604]